MQMIFQDPFSSLNPKRLKKSTVRRLDEVRIEQEGSMIRIYFTGNGSESWYESGYVVSVLLLVGLGTVVHSLIDFGIAVAVWKPLCPMLHIPVSAKMRTRTAT